MTLNFLRATALGSALAVLAAHATAAPLTFDDALRHAAQRSRQLPAEHAAAAAAREMAVAAGQRPDPVLKAGVNNVPVNGADRFSLSADFMTMRSIGVMQEWTRRDKLLARSARYEREAEAAEAGAQLALAELQRDTAIAWLDRHYQERVRALLVEQREETMLQIQAAEATYRSGRGAQADVFTARAAVAQLDDKLAAVERDALVARTMLERWVGPTTGEGLGPAPDMQAVRLRDDELDAGLAHHPAVSMLERQEAVALADVEAARTSRNPDVTVELMYSQRGPSYSNMVSLSLAIPLPWDRRNRQDRDVAAKLAAVEQVRGQREEQTRIHVAEARALLLQWRSNRARLERYDAELLPLAAERTRATLTAYRGASMPLTAVLDARRAELDVRMDRLRLEMDTARLWAQLNYLTPVVESPIQPGSVQ